MIYFDNAATSFPKPQGVQAAIEDALLSYGANPGRSGHRLSVETARRVYACRELLAELFGAEDPDQVVFTQNCTHALNLVFKGLLRKGDHVIISDLEHNAILRPIHTLSLQGIITYDVAETGPSEEDTIRRIDELIRPETKLIAITAGSNVFGTVLPIGAISRLAQEREALLLVDAAQAAGVLPINLRETPIDFLCMPGHKGLYGPTGTGVLITNKGDLLNTIMEGGTGSESLSPKQPDFLPDKLEPGTVNALGIQGLAAGVSYVRGRSVEAIGRQQLELTRAVWEGLKELGATLYTPKPVYGQSLPVLAFNLPGITGEDTCARLDEAGFCLRGGFHCAPLAHRKMGTLEQGVARLSFGCYNTMEQVERFLVEIRRILRAIPQ